MGWIYHVYWPIRLNPWSPYIKSGHVKSLCTARLFEFSLSACSVEYIEFSASCIFNSISTEKLPNILESEEPGQIASFTMDIWHKSCTIRIHCMLNQKIFTCHSILNIFIVSHSNMSIDVFILKSHLRGNVWVNQRGAPSCRANLRSFSGHQKYSWIQGWGPQMVRVGTIGIGAIRPLATFCRFVWDEAS